MNFGFSHVFFLRGNYVQTLVKINVDFSPSEDSNFSSPHCGWVNLIKLVLSIWIKR